MKVVSSLKINYKICQYNILKYCMLMSGHFKMKEFYDQDFQKNKLKHCGY